MELGWTQAELAKRTGYSERLIVKLEGGGSVSRNTVENVCKAFNEAGRATSFADLACDPTQLAREFLEGMYRHRGRVVDETAHFLDPEIVFIFNGDPEIFPFAGRHAGIDAGRRAFQAFFSILEPPSDLSELDDWEYLPTSNGVLVWGDSWIHPIGKPMDKPVKVAVRCEFRDGLMVHWEDRFDTQAGAEVILSSKEDSS